MAERVTLLGGEFELQSKPGRGSRLTARLKSPVHKK
jgi:signal transduction histidine kinase